MWVISALRERESLVEQGEEGQGSKELDLLGRNAGEAKGLENQGEDEV